MDFWDAMIAQSAVAADCTLLFAQDFQHGFQLGSPRLQKFFSLLTPEHEESRTCQAKTRPQIVPCDFFPHVEKTKPGEYNHGEDFLNHFELRKTEIGAPDTVCRNLKAVFEKSDAPTKNDSHQERPGAHVFQMAVPGIGHEKV